MKKNFFVSALVLGAGSVLSLNASSLADEPPVQPVVMPVLTNAPVSNVFVPVGFDNNDTVEVILHGHFKDSCNKIGPVLGAVDEDSKVISVGVRALRYQGNECIEMEVPFVQSVKLGQLAVGSYSVELGTAGLLASKTLEVSQATASTADDSLYAPVDAVDFTPTPSQVDNYTLTVSGIFPRSDSGCMKIQELKILPYEEMLIVLPLAVFERDLSLCQGARGGGNTPFERKFSVSAQVPFQLVKDTLIHVRVLNGQSLNRVIEVEN